MFSPDGTLISASAAHHYGEGVGVRREEGLLYVGCGRGDHKYLDGFSLFSICGGRCHNELGQPAVSTGHCTKPVVSTARCVQGLLCPRTFTQHTWLGLSVQFSPR